MQYLFDEKGRRYLDVSRAIANQQRSNIGPLAPAAFTSCLSESYYMQQLTAVCLLHQLVRQQSCTPHILAGLCRHRDRERWSLPPRGGCSCQQAERAAAAHHHHLPQQPDSRVCQGAGGQDAWRPQGNTHLRNRHLLPCLVAKIAAAAVDECCIILPC